MELLVVVAVPPLEDTETWLGISVCVNTCWPSGHRPHLPGPTLSTPLHPQKAATSTENFKIASLHSEPPLRSDKKSLTCPHVIFNRGMNRLGSGGSMPPGQIVQSAVAPGHRQKKGNRSWATVHVRGNPKCVARPMRSQANE